MAPTGKANAEYCKTYLQRNKETYRKRDAERKKLERSPK